MRACFRVGDLWLTCGQQRRDSNPGTLVEGGGPVSTALVGSENRGGRQCRCALNCALSATRTRAPRREAFCWARGDIMGFLPKGQRTRMTFHESSHEGESAGPPSPRRVDGLQETALMPMACAGSFSSLSTAISPRVVCSPLPGDSPSLSLSPTHPHSVPVPPSCCLLRPAPSPLPLCPVL